MQTGFTLKQELMLKQKWLSDQLQIVEGQLAAANLADDTPPLISLVTRNVEETADEAQPSNTRAAIVDRTVEKAETEEERAMRQANELAQLRATDELARQQMAAQAQSDAQAALAEKARRIAEANAARAVIGISRVAGIR